MGLNLRHKNFTKLEENTWYLTISGNAVKIDFYDKKSSAYISIARDMYDSDGINIEDPMCGDFLLTKIRPPLFLIVN